MRAPGVMLIVAACGGGHAGAPPVIGGTAAAPGDPIVLAQARLHPVLVATDGDAVYWTETATTDAGATSSSLLRIATGDAAAPPAVIVHTAGAIGAVALDGDTVYFTLTPPDGAAQIHRLAHGGPDAVVVADAGASQLAVDRDRLYWGTGGGQVATAPKASPGAPAVLADSVEYSYMDGFAIDATGVYFANELDDTPRRIYRVAKAGGEVTRADDAGGVGRWSVAGGGVYYDADGAIWKTIAGAEPEPVRIGPGELAGAAGDRLVLIEDGRLHDRSIETGASGRADLAIGDDIRQLLVGADAIWLIRDPDPDDDTASADLLAYAP